MVRRLLEKMGKGRVINLKYGRSMSLRGKVLSLILVTFIVYGALDYGVQRLFILPSFTTLERDESAKDMGRAVQAIAREVEHLGSSVADWALWDDTYHYTQDRNDAYREANLNEATLTGLKINVMYIFDEHDQLVWEMVYDLDNEEKTDIEGLEKQLSAIRLPNTTSSVDGVLLTAHGPILISAKPILTSNGEGPAKGHFVMGRFLNTKSISDQARITLRETPLDATTISPDTKALVEKVWQQQEPYIFQEDEVNRVYSVMPDIAGKPALLLEVDVPRSITARGQRAVSFALASLLGAGLLIILLLIVVIEKMVLKPLRNLTDHAVEIGRSNDLTVHLAEDRKDEIGILGQEFNRMIEQLASARKTLMDQSYQSGRAEVAVNVLHNVGNALNGVVISSYQLIEKARNSYAGDVSKVAGLLQEPEGGLATFLSEDPRGMKIPQYLASVGTALEEERQFVLSEAMELQDKVNHIKDIISRQESFSKQSQLRQSEQPDELLEEALKLSTDQRENKEIEVERDYQSVPKVKVDRHKVLQILLNLINNARDACMKSDRPDKKIVLRLFGSQSDRVVMQVVDNGIGIASEALERIFEHGYLSHKAGKSFGLHSSSLAAYELGGKLTIESDGPGFGASSTLELPCIVEQTK